MRSPLVAAVLVALAAGAGALAAGCGGTGEPAPKTPELPAQRLPRSEVPSTRLAAFPDGPEIGFSDNRPETLLDPAFQATGIKRVRKIVPFDDIVRGGPRLAELDAWFTAAKDTGVEPLVTFYRSYRDIRYLPTVAEFRRSFRAVRKRYPWVRLFSTWNEANFAAAQPTGRDPRRTGRFYKAAREECAGGRCAVLACDFRADGSAQSDRWLREFKQEIGPGRHTWGLVSHPDVNRRTGERTRGFLRQTRGPVWAVEVGALNFFGRGVPPSLPRQTRAMRYIVDRYPGVSRRLERLYVYQWRAAPGNELFDSALLSVEGRQRPALRVFLEAIGRTAN